MASEDVIELGSSEDETEPAAATAAKKPKRIPNAMVHIPNKLPELTIKPAKSASKGNVKNVKSIPARPLVPGNLKRVNIPTGSPVGKMNGKTLTVSRLPPPQASKEGKLVKNPLRNPGLTLVQNANANSINPLNMFKNSQIQINKVPKIPVISPMRNLQILNNPIKIHSTKSLNNLPSGITVVKTNTLTNASKKPATVANAAKRPACASNATKRPAGASNAAKRPAAAKLTVANKRRKNSSANQSEVLTVDLDDDEASSPSTSGPCWYLRPEDQTDVSKEKSLTPTKKDSTKAIQDKNNSEPDPTRMIEITIEDSPIKLIQNKRTHEIGAELAITIDDSPVKAVAEKDPLGSDKEGSDSGKTPKSKKKLNYPQETDVITETATIEIEIEPMEITTDQTHSAEAEAENDVEIFESPAKPKKSDTPQNIRPKTVPKPQIEPKIVPKPQMEPIAQSSSNGEFHPVYQQFIDLCFRLENSDDMKKIVEKKIKAYYKQVPKEYTESEEFIDMVSGKIVSMQAGPEKMYLYIKDIVDELNLQRRMVKTQPPKKETNATVEKFQFPEDGEFDEKRQRQIRKLEKTIKKLHRAIQKLEEQEVDFDDDEDSVYLLTESDEDSTNKEVNKPLVKDRSALLQRYKERMVRVHAKFCQLTNTKLPSEPRVVIESRPGQPSGPAKRLEKWINRKVPIGTPLPFPDFHDVLRCVREANDEDKLGWNEVDIMEEARDLFVRCGKKLQRRRQENEWRLATSRLNMDVDPAEGSAELRKKLDENNQVATKKETEVFNKFADRQSQLKLEAEEIGDKEAEESPADDDEEDEANEESSLKDKEQRKERLRKLLQDKVRKSSHKQELDDDQNSKTTEDNAETKTKESENVEELSKETDVSVNDENIKNREESFEPTDKAHSISDDSTKVASDVDELHLLQKLHSENELNSSTIESTDSDTPIDISDSGPSGNDKEDNRDDVISIENSSYSESEITKPSEHEHLPTIAESNREDENDDAEEILPTIAESNTKDGGHMDISTEQTQEPQIGNAEKIKSIGNILLASSEDENNDNSENEETLHSVHDSLPFGGTLAEEIVPVEFSNVNSIETISQDSNPSQLSEDNNTQSSNGDVVMIEQSEIVNCTAKTDTVNSVENPSQLSGDNNTQSSNGDVVIVEIVNCNTNTDTGDVSAVGKESQDLVTEKAKVAEPIFVNEQDVEKTIVKEPIPKKTNDSQEISEKTPDPITILPENLDSIAEMTAAKEKSVDMIENAEMIENLLVSESDELKESDKSEFKIVSACEEKTNKESKGDNSNSCDEISNSVPDVSHEDINVNNLERTDSLEKLLQDIDNC